MTRTREEALEDRLREDAEQILEQCLRRRRWNYADRDAIAEHLRRIVAREAKKLRA